MSIMIRETRNYKMFERSVKNRPINLRKHSKLRKSMEKYGFLRSFPLSVVRVGDKWVVRDGQHRLAFAELLKLIVYWVEEPIDYDVAVVNCTPKGWQVRDFAEMYAEQGFDDYAEAIEFADGNKVSDGNAFALLAGTTTYGNCKTIVEDGHFKIVDREWAESVVRIYTPLLEMAPAIRTAPKLLEACMACCRVKGFDGARLLRGARQCPGELKSYSNRDEYLDMLEKVYNYRSRNLVGLKAEAVMAMRRRNASAKHGVDEWDAA